MLSIKNTNYTRTPAYTILGYVIWDGI